MQCGAQQRGIDLVQFVIGVGSSACGHVGDAPQDLRQNHTGVAARTVQRARGQSSRRLDDVGGFRVGVGFGQRRAHGEQHVYAGVGIGDREHVEPVDLVDVGDQVADSGVRPVT